MIRPIAVAVFALTIFSGCEGMRDALTAHTDTAAKAGSAELGAARLAQLVGSSQAPVRKDVMRTVADLWVNYQLLALAAAESDTLNEPATIDSAMWSLFANQRAQKWFTQISQSWGRVDTAAAPQQYASGELLAASHILFVTQNKPDSAKRNALARAQQVRARVNAGNFASLAANNSEDTQSGAQGGSLGVFPRGAMVPAFQQALLALRPGEISPIVESEYGYHIIRRPTFAEVRTTFLEASRAYSMQQAESTYMARMDSASRVTVKKGAAATARAVAADPDGHTKDKAVLATSVAGSFTAARLVRWMETFPPQQQVHSRLIAAPDSIVNQFIKNFVRNELVLRAADSAGIKIDPAELRNTRQAYVAEVVNEWNQLGISPEMLADSASTKEDRIRVATARVDRYLERVLADQAAFVNVAPPVEWALRAKYSHAVNNAGLDRALQQAIRVRASMDSTRTSQQPPSAVPMPGAPGGAQMQPRPAPVPSTP
ncbi:MAG TPA: peptidylprolyl isomerase [Gemmatimonadaceae bacterium]|nr:peptidylprolyl isomerase [Gemmatimonadaceae bacterium]